MNRGTELWAWKRFDELANCVCNEKPPQIAILPWNHGNFQNVEFSASLAKSKIDDG